MSFPQQPKRLSDIRNELERGVFLAVYHSRKQRYSRRIAAVCLTVKHTMRGILFSWPLYLLTMAVFAVPEAPIIVFLLFLLPALYVSWSILSRGIKEDYNNLVSGYILRSGYLGRMLFHGRT